MRVAALKSIVELTSYNYVVLHPNGKSFECITDTFACKAAKNMQCARNISSISNATATDYRWWDFQVCLQANRFSIPGNADKCAQQAGLEIKALRTCVNDETRSFNLLMDDLKVCNSMSPKVAGPDQVYVNGKLQDDAPKGSNTYYADLVCKAFSSNGGTPPSVCANTTNLHTLSKL